MYLIRWSATMMNTTKMTSFSKAKKSSKVSKNCNIAPRKMFNLDKID